MHILAIKYYFFQLIQKLVKSWESSESDYSDDDSLSSDGRADAAHHDFPSNFQNLHKDSAETNLDIEQTAACSKNAADFYSNNLAPNHGLDFTQDIALKQSSKESTQV